MKSDESHQQQVLVSSPEWKLVGRIKTFATSVRMLERNAEELMRLLRYLTTDARSILLMAAGYKEERDKYLEEALRLLHNFLASVAMVIDHARVLYRELYEPRDLFGDYEPEVRRRFTDDPLSRFVRELRNYFLHRLLPVVLYIEDEHGSRTIALRKVDLLQHDNWPPQARKYLESAPDDVDITVLVEGYMSNVRDFYRWFAERQEEIHAEALVSVQKRLDEIAKARGPRMLASLAAGIEAIERGTEDVLAVLSEWFDPVKEPGEFDALLDEVPAWTEHVLYRLEQRYAAVPKELADRFLRAASRSRAP